MPSEHQHTPSAPVQSQDIASSDSMPSMSPPAFQLSSSDEGGGEMEVASPSAAETLICMADAGNGDSPTQFKTEASAPIQRKEGVIQRQEPDEGDGTTYVDRYVTLTERVDQAEFRRRALKSLFGGNPPAVKWTNRKEFYEKGKHKILVDIRLIKRHRAANNEKRGISTDESGDVQGAGERAKQTLGGTPTKGKQALIDEINRRYALDTGQSATKPGEGKPGMVEYWDQIRDEVLFQNEYIQTLPPKVKKLIKFSTNGRKITPADIEKLFKIAKKIEGMDASEVNDYYSRVSASTTDLDTFERSLDGFIQEKAQRNKDNEQREGVQTKLYGKRELYNKYKEWKALKGNRPMSRDEFGVRDPNIDHHQDAVNKLEANLIASLAPEFSSIADFEKYIAQFQQSFELEAQRIALDVLEKYEGLLYQQGERYSDQTVVDGLHKQLGGFRGHHKDFKQNADISNKRATYDNTPGSIVTKGPPPVSTQDANDAFYGAIEAKQNAVGEVQGLAGEHPMLKEDHLPVEKRLNKEKMAQSDPGQLQALLKAHVATQLKELKEAKGHLSEDNELVYKMPKMMPQFYAQMGIPKGGICDQIVQDKVANIQKKEMIVNLLLAVLAIALAIVSYGAATPLIAAGAAAGGLAVSGYMAYDEYDKYTQQKDLADVGMTDDPSVFWLVVSVAAAALDMAAAVKAVRALAPAAKAFNASGDLMEFSKAVRSLTEAGEIEAKIGAAAEKAAAAKAVAKEASDELAGLFQSGGTLAKGLKNGDTYTALVRLAGSKIKQGVNSFHHFILEIKKARQIAKIAGDMTPDEIAKAKEAWEQAVKLHKSATEPVEILSSTGKKIGTFSNGSQLEIVSKKSKLHGGNNIGLHPEKTTTVTGTLNDVNTVATRGGQMPGVTVQGSNPGAINILRSPEWPKIQAKYKHLLDAGDSKGYWKAVSDDFWSKVNKPWLDDAVKRGDDFRFVSNPADERALFVTDKSGKNFVFDEAGNRIRSIFGREIDYLVSKGYKIMPDGTAIAP